MTLSGASPILAAAPASGLPTSGFDTGTKLALSGAVPVIVAALLVLSLFIVWAAFLRRSDRRRERGEILDGPAGSRSRSGSGRRRRRRREKGRPRNPTLAETGGLPPPRDPDAPPPGL